MLMQNCKSHEHLNYNLSSYYPHLYYFYHCMAISAQRNSTNYIVSEVGYRGNPPPIKYGRKVLHIVT